MAPGIDGVAPQNRCHTLLEVQMMGRSPSLVSQDRGKAFDGLGFLEKWESLRTDGSQDPSMLRLRQASASRETPMAGTFGSLLLRERKPKLLQLCVRSDEVRGYVHAKRSTAPAVDLEIETLNDAVIASYEFPPANSAKSF